jgi:hypothetical protein
MPKKGILGCCPVAVHGLARLLEDRSMGQARWCDEQMGPGTGFRWWHEARLSILQIRVLTELLWMGLAVGMDLTGMEEGWKVGRKTRRKKSQRKSGLGRF